jgi:MFS family permease
MSSSRRIAITAGSLAVLLGALDTYVVVTIMTDIMRDVGIAINKIQQVTPIVTGYLLGYIAAMPLLGRASDRFGRKLLLQVSLAGFAIGSVVTALSNDLTTLVIGRVIQGTASGALLPVTLALAADLWASRKRAAVLGGVGAAQELGSVLGPVYGIALVWLFNHWQAVFWVNVPLAVIAMVMIHFSLPARQDSEMPEKVDVVGGVLLAIALGLAVVGLYNPEPDGKQVLPSWGLPVLLGALVAAVAFFVWERFARTRLIEPVGVHFRPFLAALGASLAAGAALMVTLVNVELFGQGVLGQDQNQAAALLLRFLIALPIGALLGGWIATKIGDRIVAFAGLLIAAGGYWLISMWPVDLLAARHDLGFISLPTLDIDLAIAGIGLGLVIGPLTSATLRVVPAAQHGIASAAVVVARMIGMLVGIAALSAWGLYRFNQILATLPKPTGGNLLEIGAQIAANTRIAYTMQYGEIFKITAIVCVVGALLGLLISGRHEHADEPAPTTDAVDTPTQLIDEPAPTTDAVDTPTQLIDEPAPTTDAVDAPTQLIDAPTRAFDAPTRAVSTRSADQTVRIQRPPPPPPPPPGRHRPR